MLFLLLATVIVGLTDGQRVTVQDAQFSGFIESGEQGTVLFYRARNYQGEIPLTEISRVEIGYKRGEPFPLSITLRDGRKLDVWSERRHFLIIKGTTSLGAVTIRHPDPVSSPPDARTRKPDRKDDLTIRFLEFPAP